MAILMKTCAVLLLSPCSDPVHAGEADAAWEVAPSVYVSAKSLFRTTHEESFSFQSVSATAAIEISSRTRPYSAVLFVDYNYTPDDLYGDVINVGGQFQHRFGRWDAAGYLFNSKSTGARSVWAYAGRLRYKLNDKHRLGLEGISTFEDPDSAKVFVSYYRSITKSLTLKLATGFRTNATDERTARIELSWQIK